MRMNKSKRSVVKAKRRKPFTGVWDEFESLWFISAHKDMPLTLDLSGIFFVAAVEHAALGNEAYNRAKKELAKLQNPFFHLGPINTRRSARKSLKNVSEEQLVDGLADLRRIEPFYEPVVRDFAIAMIAAVAAAESFVNEVADIVISGKAERSVFDKLPVQGKWLFLPNFVDTKKRKKLFRMDQGPLQAFCDAVRRRNALVISKGLPGQ